MEIISERKTCGGAYFGEESLKDSNFVYNKLLES